MAKKEPKKSGDVGAEKFVEIAKLRVPKALKAIRGVSKLASKRYTYTDEQVGKIRTALESEVERCMEAFEHGRPVADEFDI